MAKLAPLKNELGASEIGMVIASFFMLILVIIPLNFVIQEVSLLNNVNQSVRIATEMLMMDLIEEIDMNAISESQIQYSEEISNSINDRLSDKVKGFTLEPTNLSFELNKDHLPNIIEIKFNYCYTSMIFLKDRLKKNMFVNLTFELPVNR